MEINISIGEHNFLAEVYDTPTAKAILEKLPTKSTTNVWGEEIYFSISVEVETESDARSEMEVGELAFYPPMNAFCIFFGPTPCSINEKPVAADLVNVFGKLKAIDLDALQTIQSGQVVFVEQK